MCNEISNQRSVGILRMKFKFQIMSLATALIIWTFILAFATTKQSVQESKRSNSQSPASPESNQCQAKRILVWTEFWKSQSLGWEKIFYRQIARECPSHQCELVYDHRFLDSADAVLFHPIDLLPDYNLPQVHRPDQPWVFFSLEAPPAVVEDQKVNLTGLGGVFNWTMTYRRDSDIVVPYGRIVPKGGVNPTNAQGQLNNTTGRDYWSGKNPNMLIAWMVSHCATTSRREWFVKEMIKYIRIDVFGRCGYKKCGKNISFKTLGTFDQDKCNEEIDQYMFYFAFENSICQDYVTEKFFMALQQNVVPVVFGGADYAAIAPPNSFINALNFPTPKALAEYLKIVAANATMYNKYLEWKDLYTVELGHPFSPMVCDLCHRLHHPQSYQDYNTRSSASRAGVSLGVVGRDPSSGSYPDIHSWFVKGSSCRTWWSGHWDHRKHKDLYQNH